MNYQVVHATDSLSELAQKVTAAVKDGWQITGGVAAVVKRDAQGKEYVKFFQAMFK